jgi:hypothetical protein
MRSTTFDMVAMALMALSTMLITGGLLSWAYVRETRGSCKVPPARHTTGRERRASRATSPAFARAKKRDTDAPQVARSSDQRTLADQR